MDNRVNIGVVIGVIFVLAFAVTLTQSDKQVESQIESQNLDDVPEELIYEWLKKYDPSAVSYTHLTLPTKRIV